MTLLYKAIERADLIAEAGSLFQPSKPPSIDPILGAPPSMVSRWNTFGKKHGKLVERVMTKVIQKHVGWQPANQKKFACDTSETKNLIDRIAINYSNEVAIFIECKRNLGNVSDPYLKKIRTYDRWCMSERKNIASEIGLDPSKALICFAVFDAYGVPADRQKVKGIPVIFPADLPRVFGQDVLDAFLELDHTVRIAVAESEFSVKDAEFSPAKPRAEGNQEPALVDDGDVDDCPYPAHTPEAFRYRMEHILDSLTFLY